MRKGLIATVAPFVLGLVLGLGPGLGPPPSDAGRFKPQSPRNAGAARVRAEHTDAIDAQARRLKRRGKPAFHRQRRPPTSRRSRMKRAGRIAKRGVLLGLMTLALSQGISNADTPSPSSPASVEATAQVTGDSSASAAAQSSADKKPTKPTKSPQAWRRELADRAEARAAAKVAFARQAALDARVADQIPIVDADAPDPHVTEVGSGADKGYYLVSTGEGAADSAGQRGAFAIRFSDDMVNWREVGAIFRPGQRPAWTRGDYWAPEIHAVGGRYVAYFTARDTTGRLRVGAAVAPRITGPYVDIGQPLIPLRPNVTVGDIDPNFFHASDGTQYIYWKEDGNDAGLPTRIFGQQLDPNGTALLGQPKQILVNDQPWEGINIEGQSVFEVDGQIFMTYSGNMYNTPGYAVGVARLSSPLGAAEKYPVPLLGADATFVGRGHGVPVVSPNGQRYYVHHAWRAGKVGWPNPRVVLMARMEKTLDGWLKMTTGPAPAP